MQDEQESSGHDEVVTADAPSASENHDTRHLFFAIVSSFLSSIQSATMLDDLARDQRAPQSPFEAFVLESPDHANLNLAPGSL